METIDHTACPICKDEDTLLEDDLLYNKGFTVRICEKCDIYYKVHWHTFAINAEVISKR